MTIALSIALPRFLVPPSSASLFMSIVKQKSFERFIRLAPLRFYGTPGGRGYEFLSECQDRLSNLAILESHGVGYTSYQFSRLTEE